jgi:hypothetical protein
MTCVLRVFLVDGSVETHSPAIPSLKTPQVHGRLGLVGRGAVCRAEVQGGFEAAAGCDHGGGGCRCGQGVRWQEAVDG